MEKAIKQRLLGGLVLVAGAALFLPMLLDGSGAPLTVPPMPTPPQVPGVEQVAPRLDPQVEAAEQSINTAHEGQTFVDTPEAAVGVEEDVAADAAAVAVSTPVADDKAADALRLAAAQTAKDKAVRDKVAQDKAALEKAAVLKADQVKAAQEKALQAAEEAKKKEVAAKTTAASKASAANTAASALPEAWVVQVASLSAKNKADALVQKLRQKNYRAVSHQQGAVWKVTVGPELRREVAESIKSRLAADPELKLSGWVQAYKP